MTFKLNLRGKVKDTIIKAHVNPEDSLTYEQLVNKLSYNPTTGVFRWLVSVNHISLNSQAGTIDRKGYRRIKVNGKKRAAHRLAWLYMTGEWPKLFVDHIDTNKDNNRWKNLRESTNAQNVQNSKTDKTNTTGFKGVSIRKATGKYLAQIRANNILHYLGDFDLPEDAYHAYCKAAVKYHGKFAKFA